MVGTMTRRPLPALVSLLALLVLTAIVWWRVVNRDTGGAHTATHTSPTTCPTSTPTGSGPSAVPEHVSPADVTLQVLNSTNRTGLGASARTALLAAGFRIPDRAGNDTDHAVKQSAQIRYGSKGTEGARLVQFYLPGSVLVRNGSSSATVIVSLGTAYSSVASKHSVAVRIADARHSASTTPSASTSPSPTPTRCG